MNIYRLRPFWFAPRNYSDLTEHVHHLTINFTNRPNIEAQTWIDLFSPGAKYSNGQVTALGSAAAGFYSYVYQDPQFGTAPVLLTATDWVSRLNIQKVISLTARFHQRLSMAKADGMIYYWSDGAAREFSTPRQSEAIWCIFDKSSGEVLTTETVWTDEGAEPSGRGPSAMLLTRYSASADGKKREIDSIRIDTVPEGPVRVDLNKRILVEASVPSSPDVLRPYIQLS